MTNYKRGMVVRLAIDGRLGVVRQDITAKGELYLVEIDRTGEDGQTGNAAEYFREDELVPGMNALAATMDELRKASEAAKAARAELGGIIQSLADDAVSMNGHGDRPALSYFRAVMVKQLEDHAEEPDTLGTRFLVFVQATRAHKAASDNFLRAVAEENTRQQAANKFENIPNPEARHV